MLGQGFDATLFENVDQDRFDDESDGDDESTRRENVSKIVYTSYESASDGPDFVPR